MWKRAFGRAEQDFVRSVVQTADGSYIMVGNTTSGDGVIEWDKSFGATGEEKAQRVQQIDDGGLIIAGYTNSKGAGDKDLWLIKTDASSNGDWDETLGGVYEDIGYSIQVTNDGGYIIVGETESYGDGSRVVNQDRCQWRCGLIRPGCE